MDDDARRRRWRGRRPTRTTTPRHERRTPPGQALRIPRRRRRARRHHRSSGQHAAARPRPPGRHLGRARARRRSASRAPSTSPSTSSATASTASAWPSPRSAARASNIVVDLPGVKNRDKARRLVGQTAELRFRPVLAAAPAGGLGRGHERHDDDHRGGIHHHDRRRRRPPPPRRSRPTTPTREAVIASCDPTPIGALDDAFPTTSRADDTRDACVVLPLRAADGEDSPARLLLGPTALTGKDVDKARVALPERVRRAHVADGRRAHEVQRARRDVVRPDAAAGPGRHRARRHRAVEPRVPEPHLRRRRARSRELHARPRPTTSPS